MEQENRVRMERIAADPQSGLSAEQVKRRFAQGENNYKVESSTLSVPEIVRSNVCTYFNLVFAVIAVLLAIVGAWSDMLFLPIIVANTCIGIIQEVHSKKVLDKLSILNAPHCKTDEYRTYCNAGRCDCRMDSLHAVWQKFFRNYGNFQTV